VVTVSSELALSAMRNMSAERRAAFEKPDLTLAELDALVAEFRESWVANTVKAQGWPNSAYGLSKVAVSTFCRIMARDATNGGQWTSMGSVAVP
jgi:carbonyl reductase 1